MAVILNKNYKPHPTYMSSSWAKSKGPFQGQQQNKNFMRSHLNVRYMHVTVVTWTLHVTCLYFYTGNFLFDPTHIRNSITFLLLKIFKLNFSVFGRIGCWLRASVSSLHLYCNNKKGISYNKDSVV